MKIIVVDKNPGQTEALIRVIEEAAFRCEFVPEIVTFDSDETFWFAIEDGLTFDLCFMNVVMHVPEAVKIMAQLKENHISNPIIFATPFRFYAIHGNDIELLDYMMRPIQVDQMEKTFRKLLGMKPIQDESVVFNMDHKWFHIAPSQIEYLLSYAGGTIIVTEDDAIAVDEPTQSVIEQMSNSFLRIHHKYWVNMAHIRLLTDTEVILDNGIALPLSRKLSHKLFAALE